MNIGIIYYSQTGNTERVAQAIAKELENHNPKIMKATEVDQSSLGAFGLVFLGSGVYGISVGKPLQVIARKIETLPEKVALFFTHASTDPVMHADAFKRVEKALIKKGATIVGKFDCLGETARLPQSTRTEMAAELSAEEQEAARAAEELLRGRPNEHDLQAAQEFARKIIDSL